MTQHTGSAPERKAIQWTGDNREAVERFLGSPDGVEKVMIHPTTDVKTIYLWTPGGLIAAVEGDFIVMGGARLEIWDVDKPLPEGTVVDTGGE